MKKYNEEHNLEIKDVVDKTEDFIAKNQRIIVTIVGALLVVVLGYFGLKKFYFEPQEKEAAETLFGAENRFEAGDYELALKGDAKFKGLIDIIDEYSSTKSGNLAKYYAGISSLRIGQYEDAVSYLKSYKGKDKFTKILTLIALGDAYLEMGDNSNAIHSYKKASDFTNNDLTAPYALFKLGLTYYMNQESDKALAAFNEIKTKYPNAIEAREIDKYIALTE